jgi:hypothetical protein
VPLLFWHLLASEELAPASDHEAEQCMAVAAACYTMLEVPPQSSKHLGNPSVWRYLQRWTVAACNNGLAMQGFACIGLLNT